MIATIAMLVGCDSGNQAAVTSPPASPLATASPTPGPTPVRPPVPATNLKIAGAFKAATNPMAGQNACFFGDPFQGEISFSTPVMALSDGQWMAVRIFIPSTPGSYVATSQAGAGIPLVNASRFTRSAGGGMTGTWRAVAGTVVVTRSDTVGAPTAYGVVSGSVDARLALAGGKQQITIRGTWGCVTELVPSGAGG
jgi:hypothetical protein